MENIEEKTEKFDWGYLLVWLALATLTIGIWWHFTPLKAIFPAVTPYAIAFFGSLAYIWMMYRDTKAAAPAEMQIGGYALIGIFALFALIYGFVSLVVIFN